MKGYFYLAQAQLELKHPNEALSSALTAYHLCLKANNPSASSISELVLKAKKQKWEAKERDRLRRRSNLLRELEDKLEESAELERLNLQTLTKEGELSKSQGFEEKLEVEHSLAQKLEELRNTFAIADPEHMARRVCTDCSILFDYQLLKHLSRKYQTISLIVYPLASCMIQWSPRMVTHTVEQPSMNTFAGLRQTH